jgi:hypothetical protein
MAWRNTFLLWIIAILPKRVFLALCRHLLGVIVACGVAKAQERIMEAILREILVPINNSGREWTHNGIKLIVDTGHIASSARPCMVSFSIDAVRVQFGSRVLE